jgi:hypothetical protein
MFSSSLGSNYMNSEVVSPMGFLSRLFGRRYTQPAGLLCPICGDDNIKSLGDGKYFCHGCGNEGDNVTFARPAVVNVPQTPRQTPTPVSPAIESNAAWQHSGIGHNAVSFRVSRPIKLEIGTEFTAIEIETSRPPTSIVLNVQGNCQCRCNAGLHFELRLVRGEGGGVVQCPECKSPIKLLFTSANNKLQMLAGMQSGPVDVTISSIVDATLSRPRF